MRLLFAVLMVFLAPLLVFAEEPFQPTVTASELGQQCAATLGRFHVELSAAAIRETKYQAEITRLKEVAKPKEPEKK